jgi:hypothetical protein
MRGHRAQQAHCSSDATTTQLQHHLGVTELTDQKAKHRVVTVGYVQRRKNTASEDSCQCDAGNHQSLH